MKGTPLFLVLFGFASFLQAATFTVTTINDSGNGSLRQAILNANAADGDDVIDFTTTGTITLGSTLPAITDTNSTAIVGPGTNLLNVSGNDAVQIFVINQKAKVMISGLTITNGRAGIVTRYANGAGIFNAGKLTIQNCAFVNNKNSGGWGGAIFNSGTLAVNDSMFSGNQVTGENGSGCLLQGGGGGAISACGGGDAGMGGAVFNMAGSANVKGCSFTGNLANGGDGGDWNTTGTGKGGGVNGGYAGSGQGGFGGGDGGSEASFNGGNGGFGGGGGGTIGSFNLLGGYGGIGGGNGGRSFFDGSNIGGGGGGGGFGGGIFLANGSVTIVNCLFSGNQSIGGLGGTGSAAGRNGSDGSGIGADFYNLSGTILPVLSASTLGGGIVVVNPSTPPYLTNSLATVTATPTAGWTLVNWLGDASGTNQLFGVSVTRNKTMQAVFATQLSVSALISVNPQLDFYPYGTPVKLTALPPNGLYFSGWSGDASGTNNPLRFVVTNANQSISSQFSALNAGQYALTVIENGRGHVAVNPPANVFTNGQSVTLTAIPDAGQIFLGWTSDAGGTQNPLTATITSNKVITASFTTRPTLRVNTPLEGLVEDGFRLTLLGEFGGQYGILGSTNLLDWSPAGTVTNTYGTVQFTDPAATNLPRRFYRASGQ